MEALSLLENKVKLLVELVQKLKAEKAQVQTEKNTVYSELEAVRVEKDLLLTELNKRKDEITALQGILDKVEGSIVQSHTNIEELQQEKELTKMLVDDLISSIDSLVEQEKLP